MNLQSVGVAPGAVAPWPQTAPTTQPNSAWPAANYQQYYGYYQSVPPPATVVNPAVTPVTAAPAAVTPAAATAAVDYSKAWDEYYKAYYGQNYSTAAATAAATTVGSQFQGYSYDQYGNYSTFSDPPPNYYNTTASNQSQPAAAQPNAGSYQSFTNAGSNPVQTATTNWSQPPPDYNQSVYSQTQIYPDQNTNSYQYGTHGAPQYPHIANDSYSRQPENNDQGTNYYKPDNNDGYKKGFYNQYPPTGPQHSGPRVPRGRGRGVNSMNPRFNSESSDNQGSTVDNYFNQETNQDQSEPGFTDRSGFGRGNFQQRGRGFRQFGRGDSHNETLNSQNRPRPQKLMELRPDRQDNQSSDNLDGQSSQFERPPGGINTNFNPVNQPFTPGKPLPRGGYDGSMNRGGFDGGRNQFDNPPRHRGGYSDTMKRGGFDGPRGRGGFDGPRGRGGFEGPRGRGGFEGPRGRGGFDGPRGRGGFEGHRGRGGFDASRSRGGFDGPKSSGGYDNASREFSRDYDSGRSGVVMTPIKDEVMDMNDNEPEPQDLMSINVKPSLTSQVIVSRQNIISNWQSKLLDVQGKTENYFSLLKQCLPIECQENLHGKCHFSNGQFYCELHLDDIFLAQSIDKSETSAIESVSKNVWNLVKSKMFVIPASRRYGNDLIPCFCIYSRNDASVTLPQIPINVEVTIFNDTTNLMSTNEQSMDPDQMFLVLEETSSERDQCIAILLATAKFNDLGVEFKHEKKPQAPHISQCVVILDGVELGRSEHRDYLVAKRQAADKVICELKKTKNVIGLRLDSAKNVQKKELNVNEDNFNSVLESYLNKYLKEQSDFLIKFGSEFTTEEKTNITALCTQLNLQFMVEGKIMYIFKQYPLQVMKSTLLSNGCCAQYRLVEKVVIGK